jgi:transcriptional regulator with XRE-family HTH domain
MSNLMRGGVLLIQSAPHAKRFAVITERETLADYVRRIRNEKQLSLRDVSTRSGGQIANSHISRIESGEAHGVSVEKLRSLAKGLGVPEDEIFAVARGKSISGDLQLEEAKLLEYFRMLPPDSRDVLMAYAEMMSIRAGAKGRRIPATTKGAAKGVVIQERDKRRA